MYIVFVMSKRIHSFDVPIQTLPREIWSHILSLCTPNERLLVINKEWHSISRQLLYQRLKNRPLAAWRTCKNVVPRACDVSTRLANLPHIEPPFQMGQSVCAMFRKHMWQDEIPPLRLWIPLFQLDRMSQKLTIADPMAGDYWRLGHLYLIILQDNTYQLMDCIQYKSVMGHRSHRKLTCSTNLDQVGRLDGQTFHYTGLSELCLPVENPVEDFSSVIEPKELMMTMATTWNAFFCCSVHRAGLLHFLNRLYRMKTRLHELGLELQSLLMNDDV